MSDTDINCRRGAADHTRLADQAPTAVAAGPAWPRRSTGVIWLHSGPDLTVPNGSGPAGLGVSPGPVPAGDGDTGPMPAVPTGGPAGRMARYLGAVALAGFAAGAAGAALTLLLHLVQHVAFGYTEDTFLVGVESASSLRRVVALAVGGGVTGVGWWILRRFTRPVVQVEDSLTDPDSPPLRLPTVTTDAVLQLTIVGLGAAVGREGAPRQVGGALAAWFGRHLGLTRDQQRILIACGAGAGLAAVYNVPLGGAVFAAEVLLRSATPRVVLTAVATSMIATATAWTVLPDQATYLVAHFPLTASLLVWAIIAGPLFGLTGALFVRGTNLAAEHIPHGWHLPVATVPVFTALGALAIAYPQLLGNGKGPAQLAFTGGLSFTTLGVLAVLKPLATTAILATGATGGRLTPAFATGALAGGFLGHAWSTLWPGTSSGVFAIVGAASVLAVMLRAPLCAIVLTIEFTHIDSVVIPAIILGVVLASTANALASTARTSMETRATRDTTTRRHPRPHRALQRPSRRAGTGAP